MGWHEQSLARERDREQELDHKIDHQRNHGRDHGRAPKEPMPNFESLTLLTNRLLLRPLRPQDAAAVFALFSDRDAMRYWSTPPWTQPELASALIESDRRSHQEGSSLRLGMTLRQGGAEVSPVFGAITLFDIDKENQRAEIGYIQAPGQWGLGLMHEALCVLVGYGFETLKLRRIEADVDPRNKRSCRSLERLGFVREAHLRQRWIAGGQVIDSALYGLLEADWRAVHTE